jgi:DNA-3-methyladenine glycosylase
MSSRDVPINDLFAKRLGLRFYDRPADVLARAMVGAVLVRRYGDGRTLRGRIVETEAYVGTHDLASHASKGRTARTDVMFGPAGRAYVYFIYGVHEMFNVVSGHREGDAAAVLLRAAEALDGWEADLSGPGKLARGFEINRGETGLDLTTSQALFMTPGRRPKSVEAAPRVGIDYAGDWRHELLRFYDAASDAVSRRPRRAK